MSDFRLFSIQTSRRACRVQWRSLGATIQKSVLVFEERDKQPLLACSLQSVATLVRDITGPWPNTLHYQSTDIRRERQLNLVVLV